MYKWRTFNIIFTQSQSHHNHYCYPPLVHHQDNTEHQWCAWQRRTLLHIYVLLKTMWIIQRAIWKMFCGWMRPISSFLTWMRSVWQQANTAFQHKKVIPSVKYGSGLAQLCCLWAKTNLTIFDGTMSSELYQQILMENVMGPVHELKLNRKSCKTTTLNIQVIQLKNS